MSTIFQDNFSPDDFLDGHEPNVGFDSLAWGSSSFPLEMIDGWLLSTNTDTAMSYGSGDYGNSGVNNTHAESFTFSFKIKTPTDVEPNIDGHRGIRVTLAVGGKTFYVQLRTFFGSGWDLEFSGGGSDTAAPTILPDTEYEGLITMSDGAQQLEFLGETLNLTETYDNDDGLSQISVLVGAFFGMGELLMEGAIEAVVGDYLDDSGVLSSNVGTDNVGVDTLDNTGSLSADLSFRVRADILEGSGTLSSSASFHLVAQTDVSDLGVLSSDVSFDLSLDALDDTGVLTSNATVTVLSDALDHGVLSSSISGNVERAFDVLDASGVLRSSVTTGTAADDVLDATGVLSSSITMQRLAILDLLDASGVLSSDASIQRIVQKDVLDATGLLSSEVTGQVDALFDVLDTTGVLSSAASYDALWQAWVMNAQFAMARYDGLLFQSAAVLDGRIIALGTSGFFELDGETDDGAPIEATMRTGFTNMGSDMLKALGDIHVGYVSTGTMEVTITQYGAKKGSFTYTLPPRDAEAPRAGRIKPGKGLKSQYYRFLFSNTDGAALALDHAHTIPLPSQQRSF